MSQPTKPAERPMPWEGEILQEIESLDLPESDGEPLESEWHRTEINLLIELIKGHLVGRADFYVGGNMFIHFSVDQVRNRDFRGPDFFFVQGRPLYPDRKYWA